MRRLMWLVVVLSVVAGRAAAQTPAKPAAQTPAKPTAQAPAKPEAQPPAKPATQTPAKPPAAQAPAKPAEQAPAKPGATTTAKPAEQAPAKPGATTTAKPAEQAPAKPGAQAPPAKPAQPAPKPAEQPAAAAQAPPAPPVAEAYTYNPEGRRDPFISLLLRGTDLRGPRPEGVAGLLIGEVTIKGIVRGPKGYIAMIAAPDKKSYIVHVNDRLYDGTIKAIAGDAVVFWQEVNDPLSLVKQREVRKPLRALQEGK